MGIRKEGLCEYTMASDPAGREIVLLSICTISLVSVGFSQSDSSENMSTMNPAFV